MAAVLNDKNAKDVEKFFATHPAPANLEAASAALTKFLKKHDEAGKKVVCVTSGGTTVPFERNTVRFLDNFSTGNRGAACAENFLREGYAVVFLSRTGSAAPFGRKFQKLLSPSFNLEFMRHLKLTEDGKINLGFREESKMLKAVETLKEYEGFTKNDLLLNIDFQSLGDYLFLLRTIGQALNTLSIPPLIVLAAAVSDFYIPYEDLETHKIQSGEGLALELEQVPKLLGVLKEKWLPKGMVISFKLETDHNILFKKARGAIQKYGVHLVVANELHSRYEEVFLVSQDKEVKISRGNNEELEGQLIQGLAQRHQNFIEKESA